MRRMVDRRARACVKVGGSHGEILVRFRSDVAFQQGRQRADCFGMWFVRRGREHQVQSAPTAI